MYALTCIDSFHVTNPENTYIYDVVPVGKFVATISSDDSLRILDPLNLSGGPVNSIRKVHTDITAIKKLRDDGEATVVCTAGRDGIACLIDLRSNSVAGKVKSGMFRFSASFFNLTLPLLS